jgi:hypothetical protein
MALYRGRLGLSSTTRGVPYRYVYMMSSDRTIINTSVNVPCLVYMCRAQIALAQTLVSVSRDKRHVFSNQLQ